MLLSHITFRLKAPLKQQVTSKNVWSYNDNNHNNNNYLVLEPDSIGDKSCMHVADSRLIPDTTYGPQNIVRMVVPELCQSDP